MSPDLPPVGTVLAEPRTFAQAEFDAFARVSGDDNPIHVDPQFSAETRFGRTVAHGMLLYTALWGLVRRHFPGAVQDGKTMMFPTPTFVGEALRLELEMLAYPAAGRCDLATRVVRDGDGTITLDGTARLRLAGGEGDAP